MRRLLMGRISKGTGTAQPSRVRPTCAAWAAWLLAPHSMWTAYLRAPAKNMQRHFFSVLKAGAAL